MHNNADKGYSPINGIHHLKASRVKRLCPHCGGEFVVSQYKRWHGVNCLKAFAKKNGIDK